MLRALCAFTIISWYAIILVLLILIHTVLFFYFRLANPDCRRPSLFACPLYRVRRVRTSYLLRPVKTMLNHNTCDTRHLTATRVVIFDIILVLWLLLLYNFSLTYARAYIMIYFILFLLRINRLAISSWPEPGSSAWPPNKAAAAAAAAMPPSPLRDWYYNNKYYFSCGQFPDRRRACTQLVCVQLPRTVRVVVLFRRNRVIVVAVAAVVVCQKFLIAHLATVTVSVDHLWRLLQ